MKVAEVLRLLHDDGWYLVTTRGSHRQFKHPTKAGRVTVRQTERRSCGGHSGQYHQTGRTQEVRLQMRYAVVIEKAENNYSAYVPDLPGCVATGTTVAEAEAQIREAIEFHLEGLREDGLPIPPPSSQVEYIEIVA